jgi:hypothetical protein
MEWNRIIENDYSTYPDEGYEVLIGDDNGNYDVAWFLMSGEYLWMKDNRLIDDTYEYQGINITKWSYITNIQYKEKWGYDKNIS